MERYINHIIKSSENRVDSFIKNQILDETRLDYGGIPQNLVDVKPTVYILSNAIAVYLNKNSKYYHESFLYNRMLLALDFIKRNQRSDGTFDYPSCNFMSAPDTSFCLKRLIASYKLLMKYGDNYQTEKLIQAFLNIIKPAIVGVMNGGFHTPNHRWAITAALLQCSNIFKDNIEFSNNLKKRANQYLAEGIDCNEDGEYSERSTGNYNAVVNTALISIYEETGDYQFIEYVRKNLNMMLTYIEPDDTIFTQNSTRQDKGNRQYADKYFYQFLYLTDIFGIDQFDSAAHKIIYDNMKRNDEAPDCLHILMLQEQLQSYHFKDYGFLDSYRKYYQDSGVVRVKKQKFTYSIIANSNKFLFLQVGSTSIYMKIGISYCSTRNFQVEAIETGDGCYTLTYGAKGWYYLPFDNYEGTSDWWKMDHSKRKILNNTHLEIKVIVAEKEDGLAISISSKGCDKIPIRVEICIPDQSIIENNYFYTKARKGQGMIVREGNVNIHHEDQIIQVGPGFGTHEFQGHYSGEEKNELDYTLFFNEYTHLDKTIYLKIK
ncbi:MAG: hypothetical protein GX347_09145 [Epulopiscium sp.]|nr:hypothetical protein [Candidatus Epulonipiscium sp.]